MDRWSKWDKWLFGVEDKPTNPILCSTSVNEEVEVESFRSEFRNNIYL